MTELLVLILVGFLGGILSGSLGVGGGIIVIPALVYFLGMSQHEAQGTSIAFMLPPIGFLAAMNYAKEGFINWKYALVLSIVFVGGAYLGSRYSVQMPAKTLKKIFGGFMLLAALRLIFSK